METKLQHPLLGEIVLCQTRRARRISLSVRSTGGGRGRFPGNVPRAPARAVRGTKTARGVRPRDRLAARAAAHPAPDSCDIEALRSAAKAELPTRIEELARLHGFRYGRVTIRASRTKWGCCTGDNNLSLSLFLMTLPPHLRDFVLLHELCHTVHHDHSPYFHALLDRLTGGNEKLLSRELRSYSIPAR